ncbi:adenosine deaminase [Psychromicrobium xiongbiense]|uniref:adenosine deaminase n=1 Tax=Psychromicrobium xiongbiense TaxID=3051184 RepID=UPI0025556F5E|nr:adenosine deaminase [Psychromicrobium sp. YIM S02556]
MWPTAELHVHLEGTLEAELLVSLARRNGLALPSSDPAELRSRYVFSDLQSFLDIYYANLSVLRTAEDFYDLAYSYLQRAKAGGVQHVEAFFDPQTHLENGVPLAAVFEGFSAAFEQGRKTLGISAELILCFLRHLGPEAAQDTLSLALPYRDQFIGVGLDSSEIGFPPSLFTDVYARAAAEGLHRVAHAGEEGGPDYVWQALDLLQVERIDHGNRALEDPALVTALWDKQIPLTVCPLSNLSLKTASPDLAEHPLRRMLEENLLVSVNSDDPAYFGGYVDDNFAALEHALGLSTTDLARLARNSFRSAFLPEAEKDRLCALVDACATQQAAPAERDATR